MLGNLDVDTRSKSKEVSELLTHYSRQIIGEMTSEIFARLAQPQLPADAAEVAAAEDAAGGQARTDATIAEGPVAAAVTVAGTGPATAATATAAAAQPRAEAPAAEDGSTGAAAMPDGQRPSAAAGAGAEGTANADGSTPEPSQAAEPAPAGGVSGVSVSGGVMGGSRYSHGLASAREVLSFLIELIQRRAEDGVGPVEDDFTVFGLQVCWVGSRQHTAGAAPARVALNAAWCLRSVKQPQQAYCGTPHSCKMYTDPDVEPGREMPRNTLNQVVSGRVSDNAGLASCRWSIVQCWQGATAWCIILRSSSCCTSM